MAFLRNISNSTATDLELVGLYKQSGDIKLLGELYQRYMDLSYGVCLKYLKDNNMAKDAVMSVFEELIIKLKKHEPLHFKNWLYTVVKNHCLMQLRSGAQIKMTVLDDDRMQLAEEMHQDSVMEKEWQLNGLSGCLATLVPEQKLTVELFYLKEKCYKDIARITGMEWNKVRSLIQNGRRNLKICMERTMQTESVTKRNS